MWRKVICLYEHIRTHWSNTVEVVSWLGLASSEMGYRILIDDVTHDGNCRMNSDIFRNIVLPIYRETHSI